RKQLLKILIACKLLVGLSQHVFGERPEHLWPQHRSLVEGSLVGDDQSMSVKGLHPRHIGDCTIEWRGDPARPTDLIRKDKVIRGERHAVLPGYVWAEAERDPHAPVRENRDPAVFQRRDLVG